MRERQLYLDLDGVLADFDGKLEQLTGHRPEAFCTMYSDKEMWKVIDDHHDYFATLPILPDARQLVESTIHLEPIVLTGVPDGKKAMGVIDQKKYWLSVHFPELSVITVPSRDKRRHCQSGDVLIDDWVRYRHLWLAAGGHFILHLNTETSLQALYAIWPEANRCDICGGYGFETVYSPRPPAFAECRGCGNPGGHVHP